jgi:hypothetical protein
MLSPSQVRAASALIVDLLGRLREIGESATQCDRLGLGK